MDFIDFCRSHGLIINELPPVGVWKRYRTTDHPKRKNGSAKFMGTHGFVQNHALSTVTALWKPDAVDRPMDMRSLVISQAKADAQRKKLAAEAVSKAVRMLNESGFATHPYLVRKGFPDEVGNVLMIDGKPVLLIPMRIGKSLAGLQQISPEGEKRFLYGQQTNGATFTFDNKGMNIVCEGYATALSVRAAMKQLKRRYTLHVCFSATNMIRVASNLERGLVIADNDKSGTGQAAAAEIGWPIWMSDRLGEDANDFHQRVGLFELSQSLTRSMLGIRTSGHDERQSAV